VAVNLRTHGRPLPVCSLGMITSCFDSYTVLCFGDKGSCYHTRLRARQVEAMGSRTHCQDILQQTQASTPTRLHGSFLSRRGARHACAKPCARPRPQPDSRQQADGLDALLSLLHTTPWCPTLLWERAMLLTGRPRCFRPRKFPKMGGASRRHARSPRHHVPFTK
jgi:hypothetical protein